MELPVRLIDRAPAFPILLVDGVAPRDSRVTLELSHWPGNRTPSELRHDLSSGCALRFARLGQAERQRLAGDAEAIVNNHYDTDGTLALFAVRHPEVALAHEDALLSAASAGDFFRWPTDDAIALDAVIARLSSDPASPLAKANQDASPLVRWNRCTDYLMQVLPEMLEGNLEPWSDLWRPALEAAKQDREDLQLCTRTEQPAADLATWISPPALASSRLGEEPGFDPGRHALFGSTDRDRVLVLGPRHTAPEQAGATSCRLILSTRSWFDLVSETRQARPDLEDLANTLNELEGCDPSAAFAWRAQSATNASPELWFGSEGLSPFSEHNDCLGLSTLAPRVLAETIERALTPG